MNFRGKALLTLSLLATLTVPPAVAAPSAKAGATCSKAGATAKSGSTTLVCTKSGKKLTWVKKATTIAAPKPTPIPTPTPTPTTPTRAFRWNGPQTVEGYDTLEAVYKVLTQVSKDLYQRSLSVAKPKVEIISEEPNNPLVATTLASAQRTAEMMRAIASDYPDVQIYLWRNFSWLENGPLGSACQQIIRNSKNFNFANAGCKKYWAGSLTGYEDPSLFRYGPKYYTPRTLLASSGSHEGIHLVQYGIQNQGHQYFPAWYREGSANVGAGLVMATLPEFASEYGQIDEWELNSWSKQRCTKAMDLWKKEIAPDGHSLTNNCEYSLGRRMVEYIVARDKNFDNVRKVFEVTGPNMTFAEAFKKYHGQDVADFLKEMDTYFEKLGWDKVRTY